MSIFIRFTLYIMAGASLVLAQGCVSTRKGDAALPPKKGAPTPDLAVNGRENVAPPKEQPPSPKQEGGKAAVDTSGTFYAEEHHNGNLYIIGKTSSLLDFLRNKDLPNAVTKPGKGPRGETVVVETDPANPAMEERLWKEFLKWNFYSAEEQHAGQVFVIGKLQSHLYFLQNKKLPSSVQVTLPGSPATTVYFETEEGNDHLLARLKKEYAEKHGVTIE